MQTLASEKPMGDLREAIGNLWAAVNRRCEDATKTIWARSLMPHDGPALRRVFREIVESGETPNLGLILVKVRGIEKAQEGPTLHILSPDERAKSSGVAVLAMLWLHYAKGWRFADFAGTAFERAFGQDPAQVLQSASERYDKKTILAWMRGQEMAGH